MDSEMWILKENVWHVLAKMFIRSQKYGTYSQKFSEGHKCMAAYILLEIYVNICKYIYIYIYIYIRHGMAWQMANGKC